MQFYFESLNFLHSNQHLNIILSIFPLLKIFLKHVVYIHSLKYPHMVVTLKQMTLFNGKLYLRKYIQAIMAPHSSTLAWRIPWMEEPGGLLSIGSHRVRQDWGDLACMHALEKEMATHSSVLVWRIPGTVEPGGLPSMGSHRVRHDWSDLAAAAAMLWSSWGYPF